MKKITFLFFLFFLYNLNAEKITGSLSTISNSNIKIGEKINLLLKIPNLKQAKVLWQDLTCSSPDAEIYSKKDFYKDNFLNMEIEFTFFKGNNYNQLYFTIPVNKANGEMIYAESDRYDIIVQEILSKEQKENLKNIDDPSKIELKNEKEQARFPFNFSIYIIIFFIILIFVLIVLFCYYLFYKFLFKKGNYIDKVKIPPYQMFLANLERIIFDKKDDRKTIEKKLSDLTETLKELIYGEFSLFAPSETTKELIISLREINFNDIIITLINKLFNEIDMVKFAKAETDFDKLNNYHDQVRKLGCDIHSYKLTILEKEKEEELNLAVNK